MSPAVENPTPSQPRGAHDGGPPRGGEPHLRARAPARPGTAGGTPGQGRQDADAFTSWYTRECPRVFGYLLRRTGDAALAEDLAAEVFTIAWKTHDGGVPRPGWTFVTARNLLSNQRRADARFADLHRELAHQVRTGAVAGFGPAPDEADVKTSRFVEAIALLNAEQRDLLLARYWDELSTAECAQLFLCSVPAVKVRLHRVRMVLAAHYRALAQADHAEETS